MILEWEEQYGIYRAVLSGNNWAEIRRIFSGKWELEGEFNGFGFRNSILNSPDQGKAWADDFAQLYGLGGGAGE